MKLSELKNPGAFKGNLQKMADNLSLGDVKEALRASDMKKFDSELVKKIQFASSFRKRDDNVAGDAYSTVLELPNVGSVSVTFKMKNGVAQVVELSQAEDPDAVE